MIVVRCRKEEKNIREGGQQYRLHVHLRSLHLAGRGKIICTRANACVKTREEGG